MVNTCFYFGDWGLPLVSLFQTKMTIVNVMRPRNAFEDAKPVAFQCNREPQKDSMRIPGQVSFNDG